MWTTSRKLLPFIGCPNELEVPILSVGAKLDAAVPYLPAVSHRDVAILLPGNHHWWRGRGLFENVVPHCFHAV
jgi:hypothetical protein